MPDFAKALRPLRPPKPPQRHLFQADHPATSLSRQLQFLKSGLNRSAVETRSFQSTVLPDGEDETTPYGKHFVVRNVFNSDHFHGKVRIGRLSCADLRRLMVVMREKGSVPERDGILFLDTETTGIQGGTGICPFMVGVGFFTGEDFHMVQYFIRDFDEEPSMLYALGRLIENYRLVVTYNGGSFDIPLLETRFTLARFDNPFTAMSHLDMLTSARRLWRNGHGSCRLVALEREIASFMRGPDVPGSMIPRAYFDFLEHRPSPALTGTFTHNVHDVVSLAALTICASDRVTAPPAVYDDPLDLYSVARVLENTQEWKRCMEFYEVAIAGGLPEPVWFKAQENLAVICRRVGDHERALAICQELRSHPVFSLAAYEGSAIYYERVAGDPGHALLMVEEGLARIGKSCDEPRALVSLQARRERLRQKVIQF